MGEWMEKVIHTPSALFAELKKYDTPTLCNALEVVCGHKDTEGFTKKRLLCAQPQLSPIVGRAKTARITCSKKSEATADQIIDYYRYMAEGEGEWLVVIEDVDEQPIGAWWGEVNTAIHYRLGLQGVLTNGAMRDLTCLKEGFQVIAATVLPSHSHVQPLECGKQVSIAGMEVNHGDIIHADQHGALILPEEHLEALVEAVSVVQKQEGRILKLVNGNDFSFAQFEDLLRSDLDIH